MYKIVQHALSAVVVIAERNFCLHKAWLAQKSKLRNTSCSYESGHKRAAMKCVKRRTTKQKGAVSELLLTGQNRQVL